MRVGVRRDVAMLGLGAAGLVILVTASAAGGGAVDDAGPVEPRVHEVKSGDTLVKLAERHGVTVMAIVAENGLPSARVVLRIGQRLVVPSAPPSGVRRVAVRQGDADQRASARPVSPPVSPRAPAHLELGVPDVDELGGAFVWPIEGPVSSASSTRAIRGGSGRR